MEFRVKGPRTYRKKFPDKHVLVLMAVSPASELLIEGPVSEEFFERIVKLYVEEFKKKLPKETTDAGSNSDHSQR